MPTPVYTTYTTAAFLAQLVDKLPIGTNLGIAHLLFTILAGHLRASRGALFPALAQTGLADKQTRQAETALREGKWNLTSLLTQLNGLIHDQKQAQPVRIGDYRPLLLDWVGFFRPHLFGCGSKHFDSRAGKALPAIELGLIAPVLQVGKRFFPSLTGLTRTGDTLALLRAARARQKDDEVIVVDRQVKIGHLHAAGITLFVVRGALNLVAYRKEVPPQPAGKRGRKPTRGERVRPVARRYKGRLLPATPPDRVERFVYQGRLLTCHCFDALVVAGCPLVFATVVVVDPRYKHPWVLLTDLDIIKAGTEVIFRLYRSRWHVEQLPLTGKQLLGGHHSFVHADSCRYRLPELCLLAASISLYLSAISPAVPTGFWDKYPLPTPGRFARALSGALMPGIEVFAGVASRVRPKGSVHAHLPKGAAANRRYRGQRAIHPFTGK